MKRNFFIFLIFATVTHCLAESQGWAAIIKTECLIVLDSEKEIHGGESERAMTAKFTLISMAASQEILEKIENSRLWSSSAGNIQKKLREIISVDTVSEDMIRFSIIGLEDDLAKDILKVLAEFYCTTGRSSKVYDEEGNITFEEECIHIILRYDKI